MNKQDLAQYLVNLHTLMTAQSQGQHSMVSNTLAQEYERVWGELKETIKKEQENEARKS